MKPRASKPCVRCGVTDRNGKGECRPCSRATARAWREANPEKVRAAGAAYRANMTADKLALRAARTREWILAHPDDDRSYQAKYREANRGTIRRKWRAHRYGLSLADQVALLQSQGDACAICSAPLTLDVGGGAHLDHDHDTGLARGFLCRNCNSLLGMAKDSPSRLRAAALYLDRRQPKLRLAR